MDIVFVILNYNIVTETVDCVRSIIEHIDTDYYHIIVVDNGSTAEVCEKLKSEKLLHDSHVTLLYLEKNLGFAQGNNRGIEQATRLCPKFICCTNNDTLLLQKDFYRTLVKKYDETNAAVIAPLVILNNNEKQCFNPGIKTIEGYEQELEFYKRQLESKPAGLKHFIKSIKPIYNAVRQIKSWQYRRTHWCDPMQQREDVLLHGCCLIFTPVFFSDLTGFHPETFLYREEELLYFMVKSAHQKTLYCPDLQIRHLEDASTNSIVCSQEERRVRYIKNQIDSLTVLISVLKNQQDEVSGKENML